MDAPKHRLTCPRARNRDVPGQAPWVCTCGIQPVPEWVRRARERDLPSRIEGGVRS